MEFCFDSKTEDSNLYNLGKNYTFLQLILHTGRHKYHCSAVLFYLKAGFLGGNLAAALSLDRDRVCAVFPEGFLTTSP